MFLELCCQLRTLEDSIDWNHPHGKYSISIWHSMQDQTSSGHNGRLKWECCYKGHCVIQDMDKFQCVQVEYLGYECFLCLYHQTIATWLGVKVVSVFTSTLKSSSLVYLLSASRISSTISTLRFEYFRKAQNFSKPYNWPEADKRPTMRNIKA